MPKYSVGIGYPGTTYLSTKTVYPSSEPPQTTHPFKKKRENTHHTPRHPPRKQRKPQKQHKPRLPRDPTTRITKTVRAQPTLLDRVDYQHPQRRADPRDPVDEADVHGRAVFGAVRERCGVDEEEEAEGELEGFQLVSGCVRWGWDGLGWIGGIPVRPRCIRLRF